MITREAVEWCLYIGCLLPLIAGYPFIITMLFLLLPAMMLPYAAMGILSGYWPGLSGWLPWVTPAARPGLHLTWSGTMRRVQQVSVYAENWVNAQLQQIWEVMAFTQEAAALRLRDVRTSGCGWRTETRISSAKDGHKPAMTTMWLKKGHGFELRRLLMRKKPVQIALVSHKQMNAAQFTDLDVPSF